MSLYNMLFGMNPNTDIILALLGMKIQDIERFRDCGIDYTKKQIWIYTRTGGGNREDYPNVILTHHPCYISDADDDFDCTYATYVFKFPQDLENDIICLENPSETGIPASIIRSVVSVMERPPTEQDIYARNRAVQQRRFYELLKCNTVMFENGWLWIPLCDDGMDRMLDVIERTGGKCLGDSIYIPKLEVIVNAPKYKHDPKNISRVAINMDTKNGLDYDCIKRYIELFKDKYPNAIKLLEEMTGESHGVFRV